MSINSSLAEKGVSEVLHFTTNRGLVGILASGGIRARRGLAEDDYLQNILHENAIFRPEDSESFDKSEDWLDYVNLSISAINASYMGFSKKWPHNQEIWWSILSFDPVIASHNDVYFATTNNGYEHCRRRKGEDGLEALFATPIARKGSWRGHRGMRPSNLPTCQQAEVLYPQFLAIDFLRHIYVQEEEHGDAVRGWLREFVISNVGVTVDDAVFRGFPN